MNRFCFWKRELYNKQFDQGCNKHLEYYFFLAKAFNPLHLILDHFQLQIIESHYSFYNT